MGDMSVYRAARVYTVPKSTLSDRTRNNEDLKCTPGTQVETTYEEEMKLADHIVFIVNIGYGYSVNDVRCMAPIMPDPKGRQ